MRLTKIYFSMLTLAFSQIVWAICFQVERSHRRRSGYLPDIPYPDLDWMAAIPGLDGFRIGDYFYLVTLALVALCIAALHRITASPFGRMLTTIRENPERAAFIGVNVRPTNWRRSSLRAGFAGFAGGLFGIFNRGVFADFLYWPKSAEVLIMTILGGMNHFWGPAVGTAMLVMLNQQITSYTEYWPLVLGTILLVLLFVFPGGLVGALDAGLARRAHSRRAPRCLRSRSVQVVRRIRRGVRVSLTVDRPADRRGHWPERRGQVHLLQPDHRPSAPRYRQHPAERPRHHRHRAA